MTVIFRSVPSVAGCNISSGPDSTVERTSQAVFGTAASGQPPPTLGTPSGSLRRPSLTGLGDEEDMPGKKRPNAPWYSQAVSKYVPQWLFSYAVDVPRSCIMSIISSACFFTVKIPSI